jgi:hypothetical protein
MSPHFNLLNVLRRTPKDVLKLYALRRAILTSFDWGERNAVDADRLAKALKAEGEKVYHNTVIEFRRLWNLQGLEFTQGVFNEARFHRDETALRTLQALKSHLAKALWTILERPALIKNAKILRDIDKLPNGAWLKYALRPGLVSTAVEQALQDALVDFFTQNQFRGSNCKVDCLLRDDENVFYAYSEDHPDSDLSFDGACLRRRSSCRCSKLSSNITTRSERSKSISVVIAQSAPNCAYFSLVPCLAKRSMSTSTRMHQFTIRDALSSQALRFDTQRTGIAGVSCPSSNALRQFVA